jgi:ubiquitin carboxyl-terminal hydrolase 5/13
VRWRWCTARGQQPPRPNAASPPDPSKYELVGFVSHMGPNSHSGHYVCHIKKEGRWILFNDEKVPACALATPAHGAEHACQVAVSEAPPFDLGYLYLFRRCA